MVQRRELVASGLVAGLGTLLGGGTAEAAQQGTDLDVVRAIDALRIAWERQQNPCDLGPSPEIALIRERQRTYLRASQKYPDFIDVGIDVWERVYDWHVKQQQPLAVARLNDGRYGLKFMFTTLLLRPDQSGSYVSFGFDDR